MNNRVNGKSRLNPVNESNLTRLRWYCLLLLCLFRSVAWAEVDFLPVTPGLDYAHVSDTNQPWSIHIARLDRNHPELEVICTHAKNRIAALGSLVSQVAAVPATTGHPLAAINGDFFVIAKGPYQGDPLGLQILDGELSSSPTGASFWEENGKFALGRVNSKFTVTWPNGAKSSFGLNQECKPNNLVLFTPAFGGSTKATNAIELILEAVRGQPWLPLQVDKTYSARIRAINWQGDTPLKKKTMVLAVGAKTAVPLLALKAGDEITLATTTAPELGRPQFALGGKPLLLAHGKIQKPFLLSTNLLVRHPRTAIGWNEYYFYMLVVDGRQKNLSMGMSPDELATFMQKLGCTDAINLDGGGSTTFWLDGHVVNSPSDKHLRSIANALVIVKRPD